MSLVFKARITVLFCVYLVYASGCGKSRHSSNELKGASLSESQKLAAEVKVIFVKNCGRCHGGASAGEGGFDFVDNLNALVTRGYIVPKNPGGSKLFKRMKSKSMPPSGEEPRPSEGDINLVQKWIDLGAPSDRPDGSGRKVLSTESMYNLMLADSLSVRAEDRPFIRYVTFQNISNALAQDGKPLFSDEEFSIYRKGFFKLINSLSTNRSIVLPVNVQDSGNSIWRINLREYNISDTIWDRMMQSDPYRLEYQFEARKSLLKGISTRFPEVRADWFVFVASIPPFYHEILNIPKKLGDLERQLRIDINDDISKGRVQRIGFNKSGVSNFNRMIQRHDLPSGDGAFWISYDFGAANGRKNLFSLPLGRRGLWWGKVI